MRFSLREKLRARRVPAWFGVRGIEGSAGLPLISADRAAPHQPSFASSAVVRFSFRRIVQRTAKSDAITVTLQITMPAARTRVVARIETACQGNTAVGLTTVINSHERSARPVAELAPGSIGCWRWRHTQHCRAVSEGSREQPHAASAYARLPRLASPTGSRLAKGSP